ncbi:MAG: S1C family serine protease [Bradymonadia bacterium]
MHRTHALLGSTILGLTLICHGSKARGQTGELWTEPPQAEAPLRPSMAPIIAEASEAVLVLELPPARVLEMLPPGHPPLEGQEREVSGKGTAFMIHPSGLAVTNQHVIGEAEHLTVRTAWSSDTFTAEVIGRDSLADLALIRVFGGQGPWPVLPLGQASTLRVGDYVLAIGHPHGLEYSASMGILSGKGRAPDGMSAANVMRTGSPNELFQYLQTDAAIQPGNSGGPLLNVRGEVVGVITAIDGRGPGIAYAVPVEAVKSLVPVLFRHSRFSRGWVGLSMDAPPPPLRGVGVEAVIPGSPGARAGVLPGDVVRSFGGVPATSADQLATAVALSVTGEPVSIRLLRAGEEIELEVTPLTDPERVTGSR